MSLFSDTVDKVYTFTNRSDLVAETALAVRQATLSAHRSDFYPRDLTEIQLTLTPDSIFQLDIPTYFPSWRNFAYIRPYDTTSQTPAPFLLSFLAPDAIFDEYLVEKVNVAYVAGTNLNIKLQGDYGGFLVGYYKNPVLSPDSSYDSWIASDHDAIIVLDAAIKIFGMIGYEEAAARLRRLLYDPGPEGAPSEFNRFRAAALEAAGR
jgi:hypothetical protein